MARLNLTILLLVSGCCFAQNLEYFDNSSVRVFYEEIGQGPALYILSGGPGEAPGRPYRQIVDSLKSFYTCILVHQRGAGKSRNIPINETTITITNYLQDLELLRKKRGDKKVTLMGVSWGGLLAMNYAALHANYVSNLILIASAPPSYKVWNVLFDNQFARHSTVELDSMRTLERIFSVKTQRELDSIKRVDPSSKEVAAFKAFIGLHVRTMYYDRRKISQKNFDSLFYNFNFQPIPFIDKEVLDTRWDITGELRKLKIPALIIYGRQDDQGESTFYLQQESLKFSETHVIEKCGHQILDEQPREFFKILMDYVKRIRS